MKSMRPLAIALAVSVVAPMALAQQGYTDRSVPYQNISTKAGSLIGVEVYDRTSGRPLPLYYKNGKYYVAGERNHEYQINLNNKSYSSGSYYPRKLAVVSVDGVNVISGDTAGYKQSGYVLDPGQYAEIKGWRKNMDEIARFYFTYLENSYAARTDRPQNTGVIGVAVFNEKYVPPPVMEPGINNTFGASPSAKAMEGAAVPVPNSAARSALADQSKSELGTGHGTRENSRTSKTEFERESNRPNETIAIYYDTFEHLVELGIINTKPPTPNPNPFPQGNMRFAPDPR